MAKYILSKNKKYVPLLIEKPLSLSLKEANDLKSIDIYTMVNNIHLFSEGFDNIRRICNQSNITYIETNGYNNTKPRNYSTLWDYGWHDIYMILALLGYPNDIDIVKNDELYSLIMKFNKATTVSTIGITNSKARDILVRSNGLEIKYDDLKRPLEHKSPLYNSIKTFLSMVEYNKTSGVKGNKDDYRIGLSLSLNVIKVLEECDKQLNENKTIN